MLLSYTTPRGAAEQQGYRRAPRPAAPLKLAWLTDAPMHLDPAGSTAVLLLLQARPPLPTALTLDWADGSVETWPWPNGNNAARLRHAYACAQDWQVSAEQSGSGISAELAANMPSKPATWTGP